jgi:signal transduction histidine kinase
MDQPVEHLRLTTLAARSLHRGSKVTFRYDDRRPDSIEGRVRSEGQGPVLGNYEEARLRLHQHGGLWIWGGMWAGVAALLLIAGYPRPRIVALIAVALVLVGLSGVVAAFHNHPAITRKWMGLQEWSHFALWFLAIGLTGGPRSPIAPSILLGFFALSLRSGWSRGGQAAFVASCAGFLVTLFLPAEWFGPQVRQPFFTFIAVFAGGITFGLVMWMIGFLRETTQRATAEAIRVREELAEHALVRARELEEVGARLSHELKNPLGAIKPLVQISHRCATDPAMRDRLAIVEREVDRMTSIVKSHLSFSRPRDSLRLAPVHLGDAVRSVLVALRQRAEAAGVRLRTSGDARTQADAQRLGEAVFNLVDNAIEACSAGGMVEVMVRQESSAVCIAVHDSGRGMPPEVLDRLGTPFFTTRDQGTGLGVVLARAVFEQHGGKLEYSSVPGHGTTATGTLPSAAGA